MVASLKPVELPAIPHGRLNINADGTWVWEVKMPSQSRPGVSYIVRRNADWTWTCTCPDHENRHRECKHIRAARVKYSAVCQCMISHYDRLDARAGQ